MTAATVSLPTPTVITPGSPYADERGRRRRATYTMVQATPESEGAVVVVTCAYDKRRKTFYTSVQPMVIGKTEQGPFTSSKFMGFSGFTCGFVPQARFSAKALEAYTAKTLANIATMVEQSPEVAAMFADPATASQEMFRRGA